ncbi:MAG: cobalt-precorrin-5B (C(1))-methyltransferase CbiD [Cyanobacteria bacterium P01_F01_bin.86]
MSQDTDKSIKPRAGYTLPVFACASAIAALKHLLTPDTALPTVSLNLIHPEETATIPVEQVGLLPDGSALAITRSDPGDNLDLTRHTPVWAVVAWVAEEQAEPIQLEGGEGIGRQINAANQAAIYRYGKTLLIENLKPLLPDNRRIRVTVILPEGRSLALRTSNAAFGVVDGLSLLGTSGIAAPLSAPGQLEEFRQTVREKAAKFDALIFCIGENGLARAVSLGLNPEQRVKTANWLGPLLVEAALSGVRSILLLGYHGKLIKLAGGIFHTHHHVADGRQEILAAIAAAQGLPTTDVQQLLHARTVEAGLAHLRTLDQTQATNWSQRIYDTLVERIDTRAMAYIQAHTDQTTPTVTIGSVLFDRQREVIAVSNRGRAFLQSLW